MMASACYSNRKDGGAQWILRYTLYSVITVLSRYFSEDARYKIGQWFAPNFKIGQFTADGVVNKKENYTNVVSVFEDVNKSMIKIDDRIHDFGQNIFSSSLSWSKLEKAFNMCHKGQNGKIKRVADGKISEGSKKTVNGSQLWQTNKKVEESNMLDKTSKRYC
ncbi:hypothetical protein GGR08_000309 [Bartonella fuyuanensis]|uniref:Uncharacterized protein n=1 Tax=Bartonella fuyuanensis TaxID=1460968 RepID=A0A840E1G8_9HYPH|nr:hypothetical protein [Bartonella fuyuanensis]